jgi:hypothetical protein
MLDQFGAEMLAVRQDQDGARGLGIGSEDGRDQIQQFGRGLADGAGGGGGGQAQGLVRVHIQGEEGLGHLVGGLLLMMLGAVSTHLALAPGAHAVWVQGDALAAEMPAGTAEQPQGRLQGASVGHAVGIQELVDGGVAGDKRQAVGDLEAALAQAAAIAHPGDAQGRLVDQLEGQPRLNLRGGLARPSAEQVPSAQAEVFGHQEPEADQRAADLIGQELPHGPLEAGRIGPFDAPLAVGALGLDLGGGAGPGAERVEFFFAGRTRR